MSYYGYIEYLSAEGFYWQEHYSIPIEVARGFNETKPKYWHSVDTTNGYGDHRAYLEHNEEKYDNSFFDEDAPKIETGYVDNWKEDHYGNRYAIKVPTYAPVSEFWQEIKD